MPPSSRTVSSTSLEQNWASVRSPGSRTHLALAASTDWVKTADAIKALQVEWKAIGPVARRDQKRLWDRFHDACDRFFTAPNPPFGAVVTYYLKDEMKPLRKTRLDEEKEKAKKGEDTPYPSWEALRKEDREQAPAIILTPPPTVPGIAHANSKPPRPAARTRCRQTAFAAPPPATARPPARGCRSRT